jgi:hypothetical protein
MRTKHVGRLRKFPTELLSQTHVEYRQRMVAIPIGNPLQYNFPRAIPTGKTLGAGRRVNGGAAGRQG